MNSSGQVAGDVLTADETENQPFVWDKRSGLRALSLDVGAGNESSSRVRLNDRGQVPGTLTTSVGDGWDTVAFRIEPDGTVSEAPVRQTEASDMNAVGEVVLTVEDETTGDQQCMCGRPGRR